MDNPIFQWSLETCACRKLRIRHHANYREAVIHFFNHVQSDKIEYGIVPTGLPVESRVV